MKSPPLVRPAMLVSLLALSAALPNPTWHVPGCHGCTPQLHVPGFAIRPPLVGWPPDPAVHVVGLRRPSPAGDWQDSLDPPFSVEISPFSPFTGLQNRPVEHLPQESLAANFRRPTTFETTTTTTTQTTTNYPTTTLQPTTETTTYYSTTAVLPTTETPCETQPMPLPADQAPHQKPAVLACAKSCKQLRNQGGSPQDGVYWFTGMPVPSLCDFKYNDGGWTLLLTATNRGGWDPYSVQERKELSPSLSDNYSILKHADAIRDLADGYMFAYRIEAQAEKGRQRWGGVWEAPIEYSFVAESNSQTNVTIIKKFDIWYYKDSGIEQRMPWLNKGIGESLLTTSYLPEEDSWGTLVTHEMITYAALQNSPWIAVEADNSGKVLYWVRE